MELSAGGKTELSVLEELDRRFGLISPLATGSAQLPEYGYSRTDILSTLRTRLAPDMSYSSGHILGAMTTQPHDFARTVFARYMEKNLGDPGLIPATRAIENELVQMLGSLLGDGHIHGNLVSGGTEANIVAMLLAKKMAESVHGKLDSPEIVVPDSAHYSFDKAADLMGLTIRRARLNADYSLDLDHYKSLITDQTIALVGIAGTTALGFIDPLEDIGKIARKHGLYYHVDGAFGGLVFPFLKQLGHELPAFDLSVPEITSYTVDPHKAMGIIPSGTILVRDRMLTEMGYSIPYLAGGALKALTITGTRPGASALSFWALMQFLGMEGFKNITQECWDNTCYLNEEIDRMSGIRVAAPPQCNVVGLQLTPESGLNLDKFDTELRKRGWALGIFRHWNIARVVLMPHVKREHIDAFLTDIRTIFHH
jgi:tyrosine decarboxylase/aspartate 1-decarboxylase